MSRLGSASKTASCRASLSTGQRSSASRKAKTGPRASLTPRFRLVPGPPWGWAQYRTPGTARAISALWSVEPSSTTITSSGRCVWAKTLSSASARYFSPLYTGITTLTSGGSVAGPAIGRCRRLLVRAGAMSSGHRREELQTLDHRATGVIGILPGARLVSRWFPRLADSRMPLSILPIHLAVDDPCQDTGEPREILRFQRDPVQVERAQERLGLDPPHLVAPIGGRAEGPGFVERSALRIETVPQGVGEDGSEEIQQGAVRQNRGARPFAWQPDVLQVVAIGYPVLAAIKQRRPVAPMILRAGPGPLANDRAGIDEDQLEEPVAHRAVTRHAVIIRQRFHEVQVGVRQLEIRVHPQVAAHVCGSRTPVAQEELSVPSELPVVGMRLQQLDQPGGK